MPDDTRQTGEQAQGREGGTPSRSVRPWQSPTVVRSELTSTENTGGAASDATFPFSAPS